jgi:hypothetical protein
LNGVETDTDCGGPDCPACADDTEYIRYEVDGVLYESRKAGITAVRTVGNLTTADLLTITGGNAHSLSLNIKDSNLTPMNFSTGTFLLNNSDLTLINNCTFVDNDGDTYQSVTDPVGITVQITSIQYLAPPPPPAVNNNAVVGTFSGRVYAVGLGVIQITNGEFRALMEN